MAGINFAKACMRASRQDVSIAIPNEPRAHDPELLQRKRMDRLRHELKTLRYQRKSSYIALLLFSIPITILGLAACFTYDDVVFNGNYAALIVVMMMCVFGFISLSQNVQSIRRLNKRLQDNVNQINRFQVGGIHS